MLTEIDRAALAAYCQCYGRWKEAEDMLARSGPIIKTANGNVIQNPLIGVANRAMDLMHKYMIEFGMTASSRTRIKGEPPQDGKKKSILEKMWQDNG